MIGIVEKINRDERTVTLRTMTGATLDAAYFDEPPPPDFECIYIVDDDGVYVLGSRARIEVLAHEDFAVVDLVKGAATDTGSGTRGVGATTYADLTGASVGPVVTLATGDSVIVAVTAGMVGSAAGTVPAMGVEVTGASSIAAPAGGVIAYIVGTDNQVVAAVFPITGLTPGINIFTLKYANQSGTGTATFNQRAISVWPQ